MRSGVWSRAALLGALVALALPAAAIAQTRGQVRDDYRNDEVWGDLGDAQRDDGNSYRAAGCYAIARLLDPGDSEWQGKHTSYSAVADVMEWVGITDDEWVGDMGDLLQERDQYSAAQAVYRYALQLDPDDSEWLRKVGGSSSSSSSSYGSLSSRLRSEYSSDELWGDLGDQQRDQGNSYRASGCYAIAKLLDPDDSEWQGKHTSYSGVADAIEWVGITADEWVGDMGDMLADRDQYSAARAVYRYALRLDPDDSEWQRKVSGGGGSSGGSGGYSSMRSRVRDDYRNDEVWGDLGDEQVSAGNNTRASGCFAIAKLLDPDDSEWRGKHTTYANVASAIEWVGITDDEWVGDMGDLLQERDQYSAARAVYRYALRLDPDDSEWQRKAGGN